MKKIHIALSVVLSFTFVAGAIVPVYAQETTQPSVSDTKKTAEEMKLRVEKRKADLRTKLTTVQEKRVQSRCKNAQGKLQSVTQKATAVTQNREKIYTKILESSDELKPKLVAANIDVTALDASLTELKTAIETFKTSSAAYTQAVEDTASLDCQADPAGFQASITDTRTKLQKVRTDAAAIRTIINQKVKPALTAARAELAPKKAE